MNEYIFYTKEGFTQSPNGEDVENLQILGFEKAENKENAYYALIKNNMWIKECRFDIQKIESKQVLYE